jgi:hypothetical protein
MTKAKTVYCLCLPVYNVDQATDTMVYKYQVLMYTLGEPSNNILKVFVVTQVITALASSIYPNNAGAQV